MPKSTTSFDSTMAIQPPLLGEFATFLFGSFAKSGTYDEGSSDRRTDRRAWRLFSWRLEDVVRKRGQCVALLVCRDKDRRVLFLDEDDEKFRRLRAAGISSDEVDSVGILEERVARME